MKSFFERNISHLSMLTGIVFVFISLLYMRYGQNKICTEPEPNPTLTGEYGSPDGWETLTGLYVE